MPSKQFNLFDVKTAAQARDLAMETVDEHADEEWKRQVDMAIIHTARELQRFTTEEVQRRLPESCPKVHEPRAWGPRMRVAAGAGEQKGSEAPATTGREAASTCQGVKCIIPQENPSARVRASR